MTVAVLRPAAPPLAPGSLDCSLCGIETTDTGWGDQQCKRCGIYWARSEPATPGVWADEQALQCRSVLDGRHRCYRSAGHAPSHLNPRVPGGWFDADPGVTEVEISASTPPAPLAVMVRRYECPHCGWRRADKTLVARHIARCWHDPAMRTCRSCVFFERGHAEETDYGWREVPDACALGEPVEPRHPVIACPLWKNRDEEEEFDAD